MITANGRVLQVVIDVTALKWQDLARCQEVGTGPFFPARGGNQVEVAQAKAVCARCPVRVRCLEYSLAYEARPDTFGRWGIFGGTTPAERRGIARSRKQEAA